MVVTNLQFLVFQNLDITSVVDYSAVLLTAQREVENRLGYPLESEAITGELHESTLYIVPARLPFTASLVVKWRPNYAGTADVTLTAYTDYFVLKDHYGVGKALQMDLGHVTHEVDRIVLAYTGGYGTSGTPAVSLCPDPIKHAIMMLAAYDQKIREPGLTQEEIGTTPVYAKIPKAVDAILSGYHRLKVL
jgi:hypothetical protein